ncbi:FecR protein [Pedobacter steynii]|uniref:FecR protein n=1 Tax=Pedobacter steynii TaxID=430522 RepID=A0A1G9UE73_9SPHI|nr:FecR family protein [Pedobacter steynii]NQX40744.1 FecR family protein [Pedobacter steynii]SDM58247.1 FecR protein [Pedobacter steynii]
MHSEETPDHILKLAEKWQKGTITDEEKFVYEQWYAAFDDEQLQHQHSDVDPAQLLTKIQARIKNELPAVSKVIPVWKKLSAVAASLILVGLTILYDYQSTAPTSNPIAQKQMVPGGNKAYLTLANGKQISLTNAKNGNLATEQGIAIIKTADGQVIYQMKDLPISGETIARNNISTPNGGFWKVQLSDGSSVWLNSASTLSYPSTFKGQDKRIVNLSGEAYFEIAKDQEHPFIVETKGQEVEVLGTHFNIKAYPEENNTKTTLIEGSVKVKFNHQNELLKPGQQATLSDNGLQIESIQTEYAIAWKNGFFMFNYEDLETVMLKISRWYDVQVDYQNASVKRHVFFGTISKYENVSNVLAMLERTRVVKFKLEGKKIKVTEINN